MLKNIQALRFFAALWVAIYHITPPVTPFSINFLPDFLLTMGFAGVDIFFVISGLIMARTIENSAPHWRVAVKFLLQRWGRIYIGWWPFFVVYLAGAWYFGRLRPHIDLWGSFFLWPQDLTRYLLPITWTLSFELYFYAIAALLIFFSKRSAMAILGTLGAAIVLLNIVLYYNGFYLPANESQAKTNLWIPFYFSPLVLEFIAGFLFFHWEQRQPRGFLSLWLTGVVVFFVCAYLYQTSQPLPHAGMAGFFYVNERVFLVGGFSLCLVACAMACERRGLTCWKFLENLGNASYSIYLGHILVYSAVSVLFKKWDALIPLPDAAWAVLALALTLLLGSLHHQWVERRLISLWKKKLA